MKIKICGITNLEDAKAAVDFGADILGFINYKKSPRYISMYEIDRIINRLPKKVLTAGVFVNKIVAELEEILDKEVFDIVQLHGEESPKYCEYLKKKTKLKIWKAFRIRTQEDVEAIRNYEVDGYLLDTYRKEIYGGTGEIFDWDFAIYAKSLKQNIILSGGIGKSNILEAIQKVKPEIIDINSSIELFPGKKNIEKMKNLIQTIKSEA
ncbi:phosphoribosylanthranilate isomerase [bacterium]